MRKHIKVSLLFLTAGALAQADTHNQSHTFLTIRPPFQSHKPEKEAGWRDRALVRDCGYGGAFQIVPFGGRSTNASDVAEYFMFCGKNCLVVAEDLAPGSVGSDGSEAPNFRDVNAIHFNVQTTGRNFKSTMCWRPRHSYAGLGLDYKQYLHGRDACEKKWWLEVSTPLLWVKNDVNITETNNASSVNFLNNTNQSMVEAFKGQNGFARQNTTGSGVATTITGSQWRFGKIDGSKDRFRAADIEVKIGYDYLCEEMCHAEGYFGGLIPAGVKPKGEFVFEPIVGFNFHGGLMWGASWGWELWSSCDRYLHMEMATNGRYYFQNTQTRSIDAKFKPWSRYMLVYPSFADAVSATAQDGINFFTRRVEVRPRFQRDILTSLVYTHCGFQGEIGYDWWAKDGEKVKLDKPSEFSGITFANVGQGTTANVSAGSVNRAITIKENFNLAEQDVTGNQAFYNRFALRPEDLDLESAATPCALTHTFYGSLGYRWDDWCYPTFVNAGASYELSNSQGAISRWMVWGKIGVSI